MTSYIIYTLTIIFIYIWHIVDRKSSVRKSFKMGIECGEDSMRKRMIESRYYLDKFKEIKKDEI
jgi:hypothetical protein